MKLFKVFQILCCSLLWGCSGGGGSSSGGGDAGDTGNGTLNLALTDAPVDGADNVLVEFTGVRLKPANGDWIDQDLSGKSLTCRDWLDGKNPGTTPDGHPTTRCIDLLALHGGASELILDGVSLPAGDYEAMRLNVNADRGVLDSIFVEEQGGAWVSLYIPSGAQSGLKLNTRFTIKPEGQNDFVIDFNLRKSVNNPQGFPDYRLKPSLKLIAHSHSGAISGTVATTLIEDEHCDNGDSNQRGNSVYIFEGNVQPVDIRGNESEDPLTTARVAMNQSGIFVYRAAFLPPGPYTVAFTCQGLSDDPLQPDDIAFTPTPPDTRLVDVSSGEEVEVNF